MNRAAQLAHVAGPIMRGERDQELGRERRTGLLREEVGEEWKIFESLAQRRNLQARDRESIEEILSKPLGADLLGEVVVPSAANQPMSVPWSFAIGAPTFSLAFHRPAVKRESTSYSLRIHPTCAEHGQAKLDKRRRYSP